MTQRSAIAFHAFLEGDRLDDVVTFMTSASAPDRDDFLGRVYEFTRHPKSLALLAAHYDQLLVPARRRDLTEGNCELLQRLGAMLSSSASAY
jgi:hypothetical protein